MGFEPNSSPEWLEALYTTWQRTPDSLPEDWSEYFSALTDEASGTTKPASSQELLKHSAVQSLIYRYRDIGHLLACTDPLSPCPTSHPLLDLSAFGLGVEDLDLRFVLRNFPLPEASLRDILDLLRETYSHSIGAEFMHIQSPLERGWLKDRMESCRNHLQVSASKQLRLLEKLQQASLFEEFLHKSFLGQKRFSLEGGEALIPLLDEVVERCPGMGVCNLVLGMAHRGRLNVLANVFGKPMENIFSEFEDNREFGFVGDGDVKYHVGFSSHRTFQDGRSLHLTLAANPSHLEAVDPVVQGKARALQEDHGKEGGKRVLPVLVHGDAAFAGQGMVAEVLNLSQLRGYSTGGTLHVILNNQIGFTTSPQDSRSTCYSTDLAKMLMVPIFHVHGEDPEAVLQAVDLALDYRQTFGQDVILELICYRRHGHNEGDEPLFTQPLMYQRIKDRPRPFELYEQKLLEQGVEAATLARSRTAFEQQLELSRQLPPRAMGNGFDGKWAHIHKAYESASVDTTLLPGRILNLGKNLFRLPEGFNAHPKIAKLLRKRLASLHPGSQIDWPTAEALAFASLIDEGHPVRLSGQDSRRGTFSQRHSTLFDLESGQEFCPLQELSGAAPFRAYDSMLSEAAVMGFDYGYSLERPDGLTIWEAQFGDFTNGAQVIIDQFITAGESKWDRASGLTLFLPHGYEGQGAEHSSARIERFLQMCAEENLLVTIPSTPAQLFHLLRRQVKQRFRKPLIVFTPKVLLRHPDCTSSLEELEGGSFEEILTPQPQQRASTLALCCGKIFYEIKARQTKEKREDIVLVRIEQLYPLRYDLLGDLSQHFEGVRNLVWIQDEPLNMGAWSHLRSQLTDIFGKEPVFIGRKASAAAAVGSHRLHNEEQARILDRLFLMP